MNRRPDMAGSSPGRPRKRLLGQVLVDGRFISRKDLERALAEQARTGQRLGEILVRFGLIEPGELSAVLSVQEDLASFESAVRVAAGERGRLGELLVEAGRIRPEQLEEALREQSRSGGKLGEILIGCGAIAPAELEAVLAFQSVQGGESAASERLRLGELLVSLNRITREQLDQVLDRQKRSGKRLGELLVETGYVEPQHVSHGLRVQKRLVTAALVAAMALAAAGSSEDAAAETGRGGSAVARVEVTATVGARVTVKVVRQLPSLVVSNADVERGYVDLPAASRIEVHGNNPAGYFLVFDLGDGFLRGVSVRGLGRDVEFGAGGALVEQPPARSSQTFELSYRFFLGKDARPGTYAWPLRITARPM